ncbi:MAG: hypothetical protein NZO16_06505, partial [Deltaproteobacteria bacterium]|nr:hypothetical protein [Deltaproteobacteria bacterium]
MHYFRAQQFIFWIVLSISAHMIVFIAVIAFNGKNFELREVNYNLPIRIVETYFEESSENIPSQEATQYSTR